MHPVALVAQASLRFLSPIWSPILPRRPHVTLIPVYLLTTRIGLYDTLWALIGPYVAFNLPLAIFILTEFMIYAAVEAYADLKSAASPEAPPKFVGGNAGRDTGFYAVGSAVAPAKIALSTPRPMDFDAFWDAKLAAQSKVPVNAVLSPVTTEVQGVQMSMTGAGGGQLGQGGQRGAVPVTPEALAAQADAYAKLFAVFAKHRDAINRVTFWGLNDRRSWRRGQNPLVFDGENQPKPALQAIVDAVAKSLR